MLVCVAFAVGYLLPELEKRMNVELPGVRMGEVTVLSSFGETPETELSFCSYEGEAIDAENLNNYYIMDK